MLFGKKRNPDKLRLINTSSSNSSIVFYRDNGMLEALSGNKSLSREEEQILIRRYKETGDQEARKKIILSNIPFVISIVKRHWPVNYDTQIYNEMLQEGICGLCDALESFDPDNNKNARFYTFAAVIVSRYIYIFAKEKSSVIKVPRKVYMEATRIARNGKKSSSELSEKEKKVLERMSLAYTRSIDTCVTERDPYFLNGEGAEPEGNYTERSKPVLGSLVYEEDTDRIRMPYFDIDLYMLEVKLVLLFRDCGIPPEAVAYVARIKALLRNVNIQDIADAYGISRQQIEQQLLNIRKQNQESRIYRMFYNRIQRSPLKDKIRKVTELLQL